MKPSPYKSPTGSQSNLRTYTPRGRGMEGIISGLDKILEALEIGIRVSKELGTLIGSLGIIQSHNGEYENNLKLIRQRIKVLDVGVAQIGEFSQFIHSIWESTVSTSPLIDELEQTVIVETNRAAVQFMSLYSLAVGAIQKILSVSAEKTPETAVSFRQSLNEPTALKCIYNNLKLQVAQLRELRLGLGDIRQPR